MQALQKSVFEGVKLISTVSTTTSMEQVIEIQKQLLAMDRYIMECWTMDNQLRQQIDELMEHWSLQLENVATYTNALAMDLSLQNATTLEEDLDINIEEMYKRYAEEVKEFQTELEKKCTHRRTIACQTSNSLDQQILNSIAVQTDGGELLQQQKQLFHESNFQSNDEKENLLSQLIWLDYKIRTLS